MWWPLMPSVMAMSAIVLVPGFAFNWSAGLKWPSALGFAPLTSTGLVSVAAIVADLIGIAWGPLPVVGVSLGACLVAGGIRLLAQNRIPSAFRSEDPADAAHWGWAAGAAAIGAMLLFVDALRILGRPGNFSQTYDNVFHLSAVRWMIDALNGSSLTMGMGGEPGFYPSAWHDFASVMLLTIGSDDVVAATSSIMIVAMAIIWPFGCIVLVRSFLADSTVAVLGTGVLVACFGAFPYLLVEFGVVYPNMLGFCLLPGMIACLVRLLKLDTGISLPLVPTLFVGLVGLIGVTLAHPNAMLTLLCLVGPVLLGFWAIRPAIAAVRARTWGIAVTLRLLAFAAWLVVAYIAFMNLRPNESVSGWGPPRTFLQAFMEMILVAPLGPAAIWVATVLTTVGIVAVIATKRHWWLLASHLVLCFFWLVAGSESIGDLRMLIVGAWYSDPYRLAALLPITAVPLAALGLSVIVAGVQRLVVRKGEATKTISLIITVVAVVALFATTQFSAAKQHSIDSAHALYKIDADSPLVDDEEMAVIEQIPQFVAPDDVIAVNPWTGASMAYALTGRTTTAIHVNYAPDADQQILIDELDEVSTNPEVCDAVLDLSVDWVLDFGNEHFLHNREDVAYPGWNHLDQVPGLELAYEQGHAALYRVTACG